MPSTSTGKFIQQEFDLAEKDLTASPLFQAVPSLQRI